MLKFVPALAAGSVFLLASLTVNAAPITIDSSSVKAVARDATGGTATDIDTSVAFGSRSLLAVHGANSSAVNINLVDTGAGALLDFGFSQTRDGTYRSHVYQDVASILFTATEDATFSLSGQYTVDHVAGIGAVHSYTSLINLTTSTEEFLDYNFSKSTASESFTVGVGGEGDQYNEFSGSASGNLIAGNQYQLYFYNFIVADDFSVGDSGASATGCVTLSIGGATGAGSCGISSVPEPMPLTMLGAGLAILGLRRKLLARTV